MKKISLVAAALTATLALGACSDDTEEPTDEPTAVEETTEEEGAAEDTATETGDSMDSTGDTGGDTAGSTEAAGSYANPACEEFFTEGGTLADRAEAAREAISNGEIVDMATYGEVNLLKQRIDATASDAPEDISSLLLEVNEPFAETVDLVNEGGEDVVDPESGAITLPEIDVEGSATAQTELETACAG